MPNQNLPLRKPASPDLADESSEAFPWYAIRTKSNHEKTAALLLSNKGFKAYLPSYLERRRWSDRTVTTERPLFPGYLFCRFDPARRMPIVTTPGIVAVLGFGKDPAPIPDADIEAVEAVLRSGFGSRPYPFAKEGQRVRIRRGALAGLEGILVRQKTDWRIIISVEMIQRSISVEIDSESISAI